MAVSTMFGTGKKCTIWLFGFSRSTGNRFAMQHVRRKCDKYCIFLWEFFSFNEKVPSPLHYVAFFSKYFNLYLPWCFQLILISRKYTALLKESRNCYKKDPSPKYFLKVTKGIECLHQIAADKLRFLDSDSAQA